MKKINIFELWVRNWENAKAFFESKGNIKTKDKLKTKWYNEFTQMFKDIEKEINSKRLK